MSVPRKQARNGDEWNGGVNGSVRRRATGRLSLINALAIADLDDEDNQPVVDQFAYQAMVAHAIPEKPGDSISRSRSHVLRNFSAADTFAYAPMISIGFGRRVEIVLQVVDPHPHAFGMERASGKAGPFRRSFKPDIDILGRVEGGRHGRE